MNQVFNPFGVHIGGGLAHDWHDGWRLWVDNVDPETGEHDVVIYRVNDWASLPFTREEAEQRLADIVLSAAPGYVEQRMKEVREDSRFNREALNRAYFELNLREYLPPAVLENYGTAAQWGQVRQALVLMEGSDPTGASGLLFADTVFKKGERDETGSLDPFEVTMHGLDGRYRWVRITKPLKNGKPRIIATIYLHDGFWEGGAGNARAMWIARARKGMPPNPLDRLPGRYVEADGAPHEVGWPQTYLPDTLGTQRVKGQKPTLEVRMIEDKEQGNHWWRFPGFTVQSSDLIDVLFRLRDHGHQHIDVALLKKAVQRSKRR